MSKQKSMGDFARAIWAVRLFYPDMDCPKSWEVLAKKVIAEHERRKRAKVKKVVKCIKK